MVADVHNVLVVEDDPDTARHLVSLVRSGDSRTPPGAPPDDGDS